MLAWRPPAGIEVPPGKEGVSVDVEQNEDYMELIHLTNVALGIKAKKDQRVTLFMELPEGQRHVLGSLELGRCEQFTVPTQQPPIHPAAMSRRRACV